MNTLQKFTISFVKIKSHKGSTNRTIIMRQVLEFSDYQYAEEYANIIAYRFSGNIEIEIELGDRTNV